MRQSSTLIPEPVEYRALSNLLSAAGELSAERRRVLTLRKIYGWDYDRIAAHLGIDERRVEDHLRVCVQFLAQACEPHLMEVRISAPSRARLRQVSPLRA